MRQSGTTRRWMAAAVLMVALATGCRGESEPQGPAPSVTPGTEEPAPAEAEQAKAETPEPEEPPPPPTIPEVHLLDADKATCLVRVDDLMPDAELADLDGAKQSFGELRGEKLTVVLFWEVGDSEFASLRAQTALEDLQKDVQEPYGEKGVQAVAVNVGDAPEAVEKLAAEAGATYPMLLDPEGVLFEQVATEKLPRPYLLDGQGRILWFDLEFSRTTLDNLLQAIEVALGEAGEGA